MADRLCPQITLPAVAYVPGQNTHPKHLFKDLWPSLDHFAEDNWKSATPYLMGFDLYHAGFYWEAHETWEEVWHLCKKQSPAGPLVQSLIFLTASRLKLRMDQSEQSQRMVKRALELLTDLKEVDSAVILGISLANYIDLLENIKTQSPTLTIHWG